MPATPNRKSPRKKAALAKVTSLSAEAINTIEVQAAGGGGGGGAREPVSVGSRSPHRSSLPLCMSRSQQDALVGSSRSPSKSTRKSQNPSLFGGGTPMMTENLERAFQMFSTYPVLKVAGTAFENSLRVQRTIVHSSAAGSPMASREVDPFHDSFTSSTTARQSALLLESSSVMQSAILEQDTRDTSLCSMRCGRQDNMVRMATAIKRAAMWQTIIVSIMSHNQIFKDFRYARLRLALEKHMLPTLLERKEQTGSILAEQRRRSATDVQAKANLGNAEVLHGPYLKEHNPFLASLSSSILLENFAETMERFRFMAGETVVHAGEPSQRGVYFLVSGKCECRRKPKQRVVGGHPPAARVQPEILHSGDYFGGVFGSQAVFDGTYKAISHCIVWLLRTDDFERVFRPFADETMRAKYVDALREHHEERLRTSFTLNSVLPRVPIYRRINKPLSRYLDDFTPLVKVRGDILFEQDDAPGDVYCLLEGNVRRQTKGLNGSYATGTTQTLKLNNYSTLNLSGRYILLGEEPHVLPGVQRCRCVVESRAALFYRIPGDRFVSALLDDPTLYVQLRETLTKTFRTNMKLDPTALSFAPILREFPPQSLNQLAQVATASVIGRSLSVCEPAQNITSIFLVTVGDVRDPRSYGHEPTKRMPTPPPPETDSDDDDDGRPGHRRGREAAERKKRKAREKKHNASSPPPVDAAAAAAAEVEEEDLTWAFSAVDIPAEATTTSMAAMKPSITFAAAGLADSSSPKHTNAASQVGPDEQSEFSPSLPIQPAKRFLCTLGGGWEGLLLEKWPNGWETTTTVEAWSIPMLNVRTEFNSCPKSVQSAIILAARTQQKEALGLSTLSTAKIPPMSFYLPPQPEKVIMHDRRKPGSRQHSRAVNRKGKPPTDPSRMGSVVGADEFFTSENFTLTNGGTSNTRRNSLDSGAELVDAAAGPSVSFGDVSARKAKKPTSAKKRKQPAERKGTLPPIAAPPTAGDDKKRAEPLSNITAQADIAIPLRFRRRPPPGLAAQLGVGDAAGQSNTDPGADLAHSRRLMALYNGEFKDEDLLAFTNIVREPSSSLAKDPSSKRNSSPGRAPTPGQTQQQQPHRSSTEPLASTMWPPRSEAQAVWFREVPSFGPLSGTSAQAPVRMDTNSALLTQNAKHLEKTLEAQADFFSESMGDRPESRGPVSSERKEIPKRHAIS